MSPRAADRLGFLAGTTVVLGRELGALFDSAIAYVCTIAGLLLVNSLFMNEFFLTGKLDQTPFFDLLAPLVLVLLPAITMRVWAEERKQRTFELWATLPLRAGQVVLGKYLATLALYGLFLMGTLPIVGMLLALGEPDLGLIGAGYLGALLLGALLLAIGCLASSLTADQVVAFLLAGLAGFALVASGHPMVTAVLDGAAPRLGLGRLLADHASALPHYERFVRGLVAGSSLVYFVGGCAVALWLNALVVTRHRT
jgi:ABC-2 type transport system permease protein